MTWLYGPLHTAIDWAPPPKPKPDPTSVDKDLPAHARLDLHTPLGTVCLPVSGCGKKPILKHRSTREMLQTSLPPSPAAEEDEDEDEDDEDDCSSGGAGFPFQRPPLLHTKSDSQIMRWRKSAQAFRKDSPPRVLAEQPAEEASLPEAIASPEPVARHDSATTPEGSASDGDSAGCPAPRKKHITFNAFVEQCIAIDEPTAKNRTSSMNGRGSRLYSDPYRQAQIFLPLFFFW